MQLIYIHGFRSDEHAKKGQMLTDWCAIHRPDIEVIRPNLNLPPLEVMALLTEIISRDPKTAVVGSSLGGFFATACVAKFNIPAVLINPSVVPFASMKKYFENGETHFTTTGGWVFTPEQLDDFYALYQFVPIHAEKILVLLKEGDQVLDYRIAKQHYSQPNAQSLMIIEPNGDHLMMDMVEKIPMMIDFLFT